jgi:hypothetical protein
MIAFVARVNQPEAESELRKLGLTPLLGHIFATRYLEEERAAPIAEALRSLKEQGSIAYYHTIAKSAEWVERVLRTHEEGKREDAFLAQLAPEDQELFRLSLEIGRQVRGHEDIEPVEVLEAKFQHEVEELGASQTPAERAGEAADCYRYALLAGYWGHDAPMRQLEALLAEAGLTLAEAQQASLIKYRLRVQQPKDAATENAAIAAALGLD